MQTIELMKWYNRMNVIISNNNDMILEYKELAKIFLGDTEFDKKQRESCIEAARRIKRESDDLLKEKEQLSVALEKLSSRHHQVLEMFYINGYKATICCEILGCSRGQFYLWKNKAIRELERIMNEKTCSDI